MTDIFRIFDTYSRQARLYPALLVLLPWFVLALCAMPSLLNSETTAKILGLVASCGVIFLLSDLSRLSGKKVERRLLSEWGGWPTTLFLRHADDRLNAQSKTRYHTFLARNVPGLILPTAFDEANDNFSAYEAFGSGVEWLKEQCRGSEFSLLLRENASYGFRRNMLGLKPFALAGSIAIAAIIVLSFARWHGAGYTVTLGRTEWSAPLQFWLALTVAVASFVAWLAFVRRSWVRSAADTYALTLLACCDKLKTN